MASNAYLDQGHPLPRTFRPCDADGRAPGCTEIREEFGLERCRDARCVPCHGEKAVEEWAVPDGT